jgi:hypothetical protein
MARNIGTPPFCKETGECFIGRWSIRPDSASGPGRRSPGEMNMIKKLAPSTKAVSFAVIVAALISPPLFASPRQGTPPRMSVSQQSSISATRRNAQMRPPSISKSRLASYGHLPMRFEENVGQTDNRVRFISHGPGYTLFLTADEAVFKLSRHDLTTQGKRHGPKSVRDRFLSKGT